MLLVYHTVYSNPKETKRTAEKVTLIPISRPCNLTPLFRMSRGLLNWWIDLRKLGPHIFGVLEHANSTADAASPIRRRTASVTSRGHETQLVKSIAVENLDIS